MNNTDDHDQLIGLIDFDGTLFETEPLYDDLTTVIELRNKRLYTRNSKHITVRRLIMAQYLRSGKAAEYIGVTPQTLRKYTHEGRIPHLTNGGGQYLYTFQDLNNFLGIPNPPEHESDRIAFYTRSSSGQDAAHRSQYEILQARYGDPVLTVKDNASGLKDNRKGLERLITKAKNKEFNKLAVTHKDRLTRFGFHYLEELFGQLGVEILVADMDDRKNIHEELIQDFMSLLSSFSGKYYRLRGYEQQKLLLRQAEDEIAQREKDLNK